MVVVIVVVDVGVAVGVAFRRAVRTGYVHADEICFRDGATLKNTSY